MSVQHFSGGSACTGVSHSISTQARSSLPTVIHPPQTTRPPNRRPRKRREDASSPTTPPPRPRIATPATEPGGVGTASAQASAGALRAGAAHVHRARRGRACAGGPGRGGLQLPLPHPRPPPSRAARRPGRRGPGRPGTGKTAAFAVPALSKLAELSGLHGPQRSTRVLVLAPHRELRCRWRRRSVLPRAGGFHRPAVYGGSSLRPQLAGLERGAGQVVMGTPGGVIDHL
ncbi:DEAD/DEAH box helicase [Kocuria rhizophila]|nr:DEAD/DEAH box helicase [Kocuria rhizophila]